MSRSLIFFDINVKLRSIVVQNQILASITGECQMLDHIVHFYIQALHCHFATEEL